VNNFVSIASLQQHHKQQLAQLTAKVSSLELQLSEQADVIREQTLSDSREHNQQLQQAALAEQKVQLEQLFNEQIEQRVESSLLQRCDILTSNIRNIEAAYEQLMLNTLEHSTELATTIINLITTDDSAIKLDVVRKALIDSIEKQSLNSLPLTVELNPEDGRLLASIWQGQNITVKMSAALQSGDVKISSDLAVMSGLFSERIQQVMETIGNDQLSGN